MRSRSIFFFVTSERQNRRSKIRRTDAPPFHWSPEPEFVAVVVVGVVIVRVGLAFWESDIVGARHHECLDVGREDDRWERN